MSAKRLIERKIALFSLCLFFAIFVGGCFPLMLFLSPADSTATPIPPAAQEANYGSCAYSWARRPVPGLIEQLQNAFNQAGAEAILVTNAYEYGEDCYDQSTGENRGFSAMDTTLQLVINVNDIDDQAEVNAALANMLITMRDIPPDTLPIHAGFGQMNLRIMDPNQSRDITCYYQSALAIVEQGAGDNPCPA